MAKKAPPAPAPAAPAASAAPKLDKDMGREVGKLGGFRPTKNRLDGRRAVGYVLQRHVEILILADPRLAARRSAPQKGVELVSFKRPA